MKKVHELKLRKGEEHGSFRCITITEEQGEMETMIGWVPYGCPFYCPICGLALNPQHEKVVIY